MVEPLTADERIRDRPAAEPGGLDCAKCGCTFIGEPWHVYCAVCVEEIAAEIAELQQT